MKTKNTTLPLGGERGYNIEPKNRLGYALFQYVSEDPEYLYEYQLMNSYGFDVCYFQVSADDINNRKITTIHEWNAEYLEDNPEIHKIIISELYENN